MLNKVMLIGNLGDDPAVHSTRSGEPVANISLATNQRWRDDDGETQEHTEWHRIVCFGKLAGFVGEYLRKGRLVYVEGRLRTRRWQRGDTDMFSTEIVATKVQALGARPDADEADVSAEAEAA